MSLLVKMAWRNLWRQKKRTLLTVATSAMGLALLLIFLGLGDGGHYQMIDGAVRMGSGHLLIQKEGYQEGGGVSLALRSTEIRDAEKWLDRMAEPFGIRQRAARIFASGLGSSPDGSTGIRLIGVDPERERKASLFEDRLVTGDFLTTGFPNGVVVGRGVAQKLRLGLGDKLVLMAQAARGEDIQSLLARVSGILETGLEDLDQALVLLPLETAQSFLHLESRVHQVAVLLEDVNDAPELARLGQAELTGLEVLTWAEALPELSDFIRIDDGGNYLTTGILFLLISFMIFNTLLMSVLERGREFTLLEALGLTPAGRFAMIMTEALFIAAMAALLGFALGYSVHLYLYVEGLPLDLFYSGEISAAGVVFDPVLYSHLSAARVAGSLILVSMLILLLAVAPAWRASRPGQIHLLGRR